MNRILLVIIIVMLLNGIAAYFFYGRWRVAKDERDEFATIATNQAGRVAHFQNKYKDMEAKANSLLVSEGNIKKLSETKEFEYLKHIEGLKKSMRNFENSSSVDLSIKISDSVLVPYTVKDTSLHFFRWRIQDPYNMIDAVVLDTPMFEMKVPIRVVTYWEPKWRFLFIHFGKKYSTEAYSPNKLVRIDSVSGVIKRR